MIFAIKITNFVLYMKQLIKIIILHLDICVKNPNFK